MFGGIEYVPLLDLAIPLAELGVNGGAPADTGKGNESPRAGALYVLALRFSIQVSLPSEP